MTDNDSRGLLRVIKVPFDIKAIFLGAVGYLIFIAGGWILNEIFAVGRGNVVAQFIHQGLAACSIDFGSLPVIGTEIAGVVGSLFGNRCSPLEWWEMLITGVWFLLIMSVFGGAICRIVALRIARDEGMGVGEAIKFAFTNLTSYILVPVFLAGAIAFFWGCNLLAGLASSIPFLGPVLFIVLFPLVLLSSLIILLIAVGGLLGLFMMFSAVSAEKNGTLDAISRAFSYIYSRPLQFFFYYFLVFLMSYIIVLVGVGIFPGIISDSFDTGVVANAQIESGFARGCASAMSVELPDFEGLKFMSGVGALLTWIFMIVLKFGILGYVVYYILGGTTAIYFALRRDVDGTEDSEIYIEGGDDEEDFGLPPVTPPAAEEKPAEDKKPADASPPAEDKEPAKEKKPEPAAESKEDDDSEEEKKE